MKFSDISKELWERRDEIVKKINEHIKDEGLMQFIELEIDEGLDAFLEWFDNEIAKALAEKEGIE